MAPTHKAKNKAKNGNKKKKGEKQKQGRPNAFSGEKLEFLAAFKDQFLDSHDRKGFYSMVARGFIEKFGYDLSLQGNLGPGDDDGKHIPKAMDSLPPPHEQNIESDWQIEYFDVLRDVSHLMHDYDVETHHLLY